MQLFDSSEENLIRLPARLVSRHVAHAAAMFRGLSSNTRVIIWTSVFWMLPVSFSMVYLRIFMKEQGLTELEIGTLSSIQVAAQFVGAICGGWICNRLGWKRSLVWLDLLIWPSVMISFAVAKGYGGFLVGSVLSGLQLMVSPAWLSLLVAGTPPAHRAFMFGLAQAPWMLGGILTPLAGPLVGAMGVTAASRLVFAGGAVLMATGVLLRAKLVTEQGRKAMRLKASLGEMRRLFLGHWVAFRRLVRRHHLFAMFFVQVMTRAVFATSTTYLYLFLADARGLALDKAWLSILPMFSSGAMLVNMFWVVPFINLQGLPGFLYTGLGLRTLAMLILIFAPMGNLGLAIVAMLLAGIGAGMQNPSVNAYWANLMKDSERPRLTALTSTLIMLLTMPAPTIAGALYIRDPRGPLYMLVALFLSSGLLFAWTVKRFGLGVRRA